MTESPLSSTHLEEGLSLGTAGNVLVMHWRKSFTENSLRRMVEFVDEFVESQSDRVVILTWLDACVAPPNMEERAFVARAVGTYASRVVGFLLLYEGLGVRGELWRVALSAMQYHDNLDALPLITDSLDDACTAIARMLKEEGLTPDQMVDVKAVAQLVKDLGRS